MIGVWLLLNLQACLLYNLLQYGIHRREKTIRYSQTVTTRFIMEAPTNNYVWILIRAVFGAHIRRSGEYGWLGQLGSWTSKGRITDFIFTGRPEQTVNNLVVVFIISSNTAFEAFLPSSLCTKYFIYVSSIFIIIPFLNIMLFIPNIELF